MKNDAQEKAQLRKAIRRQMKEMTLNERQRSDEALFRVFCALPELRDAETVLLYYGIKEEPETKRLIWEMIERGKRVFLPRCLSEHQMEARRVQKQTDLVPGAFMIPEPAEHCLLLSKQKLDLILVPALCCDRTGVRLGQGGGYYDRYLRDYHGVTVCLCRKELLQEKLPRDALDQTVKIILTEDERLGPIVTR
jgi:5-formyltetrahydrofolate cyclo-ligase